MIQTQSNTSPTQNRLCIIGEADPFLTSLVKRMAEKSGFDTKRAQTGEAILELAHQEQPVLIVLEPDLPGKVRGWEVVQTLQKDVRTSQVAVILFSWLKKDDALALVGREVAHLLKPNLNYEAFAAALITAGIQAPSSRVKTTD